MKTRILSKSILVLALATLMLSTVAIAQRGPRGMNMRNDSIGINCKLPNLTADQKAKMETLRIKHIKEVTPLRNELAEKRARLNTLESAEKTDMTAINKTIDEISALNAKMMKQRASHRAEVSSLLTDDQKVLFNAKQGKGGKGQMKMGKGNRNGKGMRGNNFQNCPNR
ncbi:MAG: Spy/CpxP family protein refolding chaperone [Tenuifilaceae bacterium]